MIATPELVLEPAHARGLATLSKELGPLEVIERDLLGHGDVRGRVAAVLPAGVRRRAAALWGDFDHFVVRGSLPSDDGATGLLLAASFFRTLRPYRDAQIVKCFRMSPWTTALSHTLADGSFHTDLNTAPQPPTATVMQCLTRDPDAPTHGQLRVARFRDVLGALTSPVYERARRLLAEEEVVMVNDSSAGHWSGRILEGDVVRFHPETLRAAHRRLGTNPADLDVSLEAVHAAAMSVSHPINLEPGDCLVVSNRRALHQRSACTVRFRSFPSDFESRSVSVIHAMDELE